MATQTSNFPSIPLNIKHPFQSLRLLEVPEEILDIIAQGQALSFVSSPASLPSTNTNTNTKEGNLHLCSADKIWLVKQVSTSNSLYITQTDHSSHENINTINENEPTKDADLNTDIPMPDIDNTPIPTHPQTRLTITSKPTNTLELLSIPPQTYTATAQSNLTNLVPILSNPDLDTPPPSSLYTPSDLPSQIPAPTTIVTNLIAQKCIFPHPSNQKSYIPSAALVLNTWTCLLNAVTDINTILSDPDVISSAFGATDTLYAAIAAHITPHFRALDLLEQSTTTTANSKTIPQTLASATQVELRFKKRETTLYIGRLVLQAAQDENPDLELEVNREEVMRRWESVVPGSWIGECDFESLLSSAGTGGDGTGDGERVDAAISKSKGRKGKWHERFGGLRDGGRGGKR